MPLAPGALTVDPAAGALAAATPDPGPAGADPGPAGAGPADPGRAGAGPAALAVDGLAVSYRTRDRAVRVVHDVSLAVHPGQTLALVGESGSGKTTTAQAVIGLLPANGRVDAGAVRVAGTDISGWSPRRLQAVRGAQIGLVPQDPHSSLNPVKTVGANLAEVLQIHRRGNRAQVADRVVELLDRVGIPDPAARARQYPHELSGGMKQRVLIASAIALEPAVLVADEPTSALDVTVQQHILDLLDRLRTELGTAVLLITHDLAVAADRADRIAVMKDGRVVEHGATAELLARPATDYTRQLLADAPAFAAVGRRAGGDGAGSPGRAGAGADGTRSPRRTAGGAPALAQADGARAGTAPSARADVAARAGTEPAEAATTAAIQVRDLVQEFPRGHRRPPFRAVDGVSFTVAPGTTHALVGESGSGKTTTARAVVGLLAPTAGTVHLHGRAVAGQRGRALRDLRRTVQLVYQNPFSSLDPRQSVGAIVAEPLRNFRLGDRAERARAVAEVLDRVALPASAARRRPTELSGGQRQRVAIARALVIAPRVVVLDEAVSALDVTVQAQILRLLEQLQDDLGLTYLFISHDLAVVRQIADTLTVMHHGRAVEHGPTATVLDHPREAYTAALVDAVPGHRRPEAPGGAG
ncbi:ABC transporter ATP-binding protein [Georgenia sp. TF02-10]|uniref:dipeptide ABC transporter ATP-binding protein n=1 Tax=Georgenia sp. TF02-10 TaxID=2917725 RepID=UPI001FA6ACB7|nr:ABC transporter ATP-binding protein [Georgenia sp. TF02-10]UNX53812.1 ABC transporter ATP-binding protein [Georgenia sp. TF02-10]